MKLYIIYRILFLVSVCAAQGKSLSMLLLVMCNSGDISIYRDMKFHIVIYEVLSIVIIPISVK